MAHPGYGPRRKPCPHPFPPPQSPGQARGGEGTRWHRQARSNLGFVVPAKALREHPFPHCRSTSGRFRDVVQDQELRPRAGRDRVGTTVVVAELDEQRLVVKLLDDRADLPARAPNT